MSEDIQPKDDRLPRALLVLTAVVAFIAAAFAAWCPFYATDTLCRYAPMAEEFAAGNWGEAFHPRFGVGMPVVAGLFHLVTRLDGLSSCAAVATVAWAFGVIPLWLIAARVFDRRTAWFAVVLYLVCPQALLWGVKGLREPFKLLGALLLAASLFEVRARTVRPFALAASGTVLLVLFKPDAILFAAVLAVVFAALDRMGRRTWSLAGVFLVVLQPMCWLTWIWTGYWLPSVQYVPVFQRLFGGC